jgi:hypothetical protein
LIGLASGVGLRARQLVHMHKFPRETMRARVPHKGADAIDARGVRLR